MAREDILTALQIALTQKEGPPPADDNTLIQKMIATNETMTGSDQGVTLTASDPTKFVWGGNNAQGQYISPGWKWSQGEYKRTYRDVILFDKPVAYYRLGETTGMTVANDSSGNGNTGTIHGGVTLQQPGILTSDAAMKFDGVSGYVSLPSGFLYAVTFSREAWVKTSTMGSGYSWEWIVNYTDYSTNNSVGSWCGINPSGQINYTTSAGMNYAGGPNLLDNAYHHLVWTFDNGVLYLYVDGKQVANFSGLSVPVSGLNSVIGQRDDQFEFFNGLIDEVAIYNYVLTAQQVQNHYNARAFN